MMANSTTLTLSLKASPVAYGPLVVVFFLKSKAEKSTFEVKFDANANDDAVLKADSVEIRGVNRIARYLARTYEQAKLYGGDAVRSAQVDYWLDFNADVLLSSDFKQVAAALETLNHHLTLRSFFVGYSLTLADLILWGSLKSNAIFARQMKTGKDVGPYLVRWFNFVSSLAFVKDALAAYDAAKGEVNKSKKDQGNFDIPLPDAAMGNVVTRFPPEPSGYLHIGHAKAALLNDYFARQYKGKLILRFDDTNPSKEKMEFEESIKEDLALIGIKADVTTHTSDYFDKLYDYAIQMIKMGKAYVDDSDQETMRAERMEGIESKNRNLSVEENLKRFQEMKNATEFGLKCCLRAKMNMQDLNKAMRDPVIYRCNLLPHHLTGNKWKIYPTYDFACPIVDSIEGVTHALRTNEYRDRNPQYNWFLKALNLRWVHIWDYSRMNFIYTLLSKRKLTWFVNEGIVTGWDDPRFPTIRGIRRRGMTIEGLRTYILMQGASQRDLELEWDKIWAVNKKVIDPVAPRYTAIVRENITKVTVVGETIAPHTKPVPRHKKNPELGEKHTTYATEFYLEWADAKDLELNEEVTLMDWGNAIVDAIEWSPDKSFIGKIRMRLNLDGDFKKTKKKLTWLSRLPPADKPEHDLVKLMLLDYDYLITKKKLEEDDEFQDFLTPTTIFKTDAWGDANLKQLKRGEIIQLERKGYYICDEPFDAKKPDSPMKLVFIPDGKAASTASKANETANNNAAPSDAGKKKAAKEPKAEKKPAAPNAKATNGIGIDYNKIKMYKANSIYGHIPPTEPSKISKMYHVSSLHGAADVEDSTPVAVNGDAKKPAVAEKEVAADSGKKKGDDGKKKGKGDKKEEKAAAAPAKSAGEAPLISKLDIVVGKILEVRKHPDADSLYVEMIDAGEDKPREVVSGLVKFMKEEDMKGKLVLILKNLKPAAMRGIKSHAMVLCASNPEHTKVEFLVPPPGSVPGDRVYFEGHKGEPEAQLNPKKKIFETVQPDFSTTKDLVATWKGIPWRTSKGVIKTVSIVGASIK